MNKKFSFLYVPCPNQKAAEKIALSLLKEQLVACANIIPGMRSLYPWKGKLEKAREVVLILKTSSKLAKKAAQRAQKLHPYDVPCVAELGLRSLNESYGKWLESSLI
jgi:periplasmic divalent cation tolerance protein